MRKLSTLKPIPKIPRSRSREKPISKASGTATNSCIISAGEVFGDGAMIELVSGSSGLDKPDLLLWTGSKAIVGLRVEHGDCIYKPPQLPLSLCRATRFPSRCHDYGSAGVLLAAITDLFKKHLHFPERESSLLSRFAISTWLADCLTTAATLMISGPDHELGIDVLRLLSCLCRHPLMLTGVTQASFRSLPTQLSLTLLLIQQQMNPSMQRLFRESSYRGLHLPGNRGSVVDLYGPKAIFCGNDHALGIFGGGGIHISLTPSQLQSSALDEQVQNKIANDFQPRLLMYRLKNFGKVRESADVSGFTSATRAIARTLAACFPEDSELARDTVELLRPQDEEARGQRSCDVNCAIVEILQGTIHDRKQKAVRVDELTNLVNALLRSRGETLTYRAEEIGWKLRDLNIPRHTRSSGREVVLGVGTSQSVHKLARFYDLPCA